MVLFSSSVVVGQGKKLDLTEEEAAWIAAHPVIRLATDIAWPPFEWIDENKEYKGMAADYMRLVEERLGIRFEIEKEKNWPDVVEDMKNRKLDVFSCVVDNAQRREYVNFTRPYLSFPTVIITRDNISYLNGVDDLEKLHVGVADGYATHDFLKTHHPEISIQPSKTVADGLMAVSQGKIDAFVSDIASVSYLIRKNGLTNVKISGEMPIQYDLGMAVRNDWPELVELLQRALDSISKEEKTAIYNEWIGLRYENSFSYSMLWQISGIFFIVVIFLYFYNIKLVREVEQRKAAGEKIGPATNNARRLFFDAIIVSAITIITMGLAIYFDLVESFYDLTRIYEDWELDEYIFLIIGLLIGFAVLSIKRNFDLNNSYNVLKQAEESLTLEKEQARYIIERNPALIIGLSPGGLTLLVNPVTCMVTGYDEKELIGEDWWEFFYPGEEYKQVEALMKNFEDHGQVKDYEMVLTTKNKERRTISWTSLNRLDRYNELEMIVGFGIDITEQNEIEEQLVAAKEEAEEANRAKSDFLANMSHEIRTPMNGIIGTASLFGETKLNNKQKKYLSIITSSGRSLLEILNEILDYSKIEAGKFEVHPETFAIRKSIEEQIDLFKILSKEKNLSFNLEYDDTLPAYIVGDETRVRQVLTNLVGNALKFTEKGSITVRISPEGYDPYKIKFCIIDTGIGIPKNAQEQIFEGFSQVEPTAMKKVQGTGLGLTISKALAEMMGGEIGLESEKDKGSTFWFTIQAQKPDGAGIKALQKEEAPEQEDIRFDMHILVVEDVVTNQFVITNMLENMGCKVAIANDGAEAVEMVQETEYDLVLMDCNMPVMDGFEATGKIRELGMDKLPIVALTANALKGDKEKCLKAGMDDFVSKPIDKKDIVQALSKWNKQKGEKE